MGFLRRLASGVQRRICAAISSSAGGTAGSRVLPDRADHAIAGDPAKGIGILTNEKYIGRLVWNRSTWPRDPDRDGKQVRRDLPEDQWVVKEAPQLRIVPQEVWEACKKR